MHVLRTLRHLFDAKRDLTPFFERQADLLCQSSDILVRMFSTVDPEQWILRQREIKSLESQGDALLQDYREQLSERLMGSLSRTDYLDYLSIQMSINPNTIQKAYTELERRGLLVSVSGKGSFVRKNLDDFFFRLRARQRKQFEDLVRELQKGGVPLSVLEESLHAIYEKEETLAI